MMIQWLFASGASTPFWGKKTGTILVLVLCVRIIPIKALLRLC